MKGRKSSSTPAVAVPVKLLHNEGLISAAGDIDRFHQAQRVVGYLRMSEKQRRKNSKGQELFRFVPLTSSPPSFDINQRKPSFPDTVILLASAAASKVKMQAQKQLKQLPPDLLVLATLLVSSTGNTANYSSNSITARVEEVLGSCDDYACCARALAHSRGLMDFNTSLLRPPQTQKREQGPETVFRTKELTAALPVSSHSSINSSRVKEEDFGPTISKTSTVTAAATAAATTTSLRVVDMRGSAVSGTHTGVESAGDGTTGASSALVTAGTAAAAAAAAEKDTKDDRDGISDDRFVIFSIDPPGCVDIDDAIHIRSTSIPTPFADTASSMSWFEVGVHIADVTNYLKEHEGVEDRESLDVVAATKITAPAPAASAVGGNKAKKGGGGKESNSSTRHPQHRLSKMVQEAMHRSFTVYLPTPASSSHPPPPTTTTAPTATTGNYSTSTVSREDQLPPVDARASSTNEHGPWGQMQVPILPQYLAHDRCSLHEGCDRHALSCIMVLGVPTTSGDGSSTGTRSSHGSGIGGSDGGNIFLHTYHFQRSLIRNTSACAYEQVDSYLDQYEATVVENTLQPATSTTNNNSIVGKALPRSVKLALRKLREVFPAHKYPSSHQIVEQLMLRANHCAAKFLEEQTTCTTTTNRRASPADVAAVVSPSAAAADGGGGSGSRDGNSILVPYLLRRQLPFRLNNAVASTPGGVAGAGAVGGPEEEVLEPTSPHAVAATAQGVPTELMANPAEYICRGASSSSSSSSTSSTIGEEQRLEEMLLKMHVTLGLDVYTHFTSPIRRAGDQVVHSAISHLLLLAQQQEQQQSQKELEASTAGVEVQESDKTGVGAVGDAATAAVAVAISQDPWLCSFNEHTVAYFNLRQRQHKKFNRDLAILEFVFQQCAQEQQQEVTISLQAVVLPFRLSQKHRRYKTDLFVLTDTPQIEQHQHQEKEKDGHQQQLEDKSTHSNAQVGAAVMKNKKKGFVYPLRLHTTAQQQVLDVKYTTTTVTILRKDVPVASTADVGGLANDLSSGSSSHVTNVPVNNSSRTLVVGDTISVQVHCSKSAPTLRKKCALSAPCLSFSFL